MSNHNEPLLVMDGINTHYGQIHILQDVSLEIYPGELVCLLGGNASGKSTTLKTILGFVSPTSGGIHLAGEAIHGLPTEKRIERGIAIVPENRRVFTQMTVDENLAMGAHLRRDRAGIQRDRERMLALFPRLRERLRHNAATLSGGEQQMLAMARALMSRPKLLLMDEPSMGLAPSLVKQNFDIIREVNAQGTTVFMVEQNATMALSIADRGYVLQTGRVVLADSAPNLLENPALRTAYLGAVSA